MTDRLQQNAPLALVLASALVLGAAYAFQYLGDLPPCDLCWLQRYVYMAAIPLGLVAWALDRPEDGALYSGLGLAALALLFAAGAGIAGYHVGVEQHWWRGPEACTGSALNGDFQDMFNKLVATKVVRCDEVAWSLFGVSMAGYNVLVSLALAGWAGWAGFTRLKKSHS